MSYPVPNAPRHDVGVVATTPDLFAWKGGRIVVFGERSGERWIVARAWRLGDRLTDVRRWSFAAPAPLAGQIRRLVWDATADAVEAGAVGAEALRWADALV